MQVLCEQRISLGQETDARSRFISVSAPVVANHDYREERNGRSEGGSSSQIPSINFGSLNDLLGYLKRYGYLVKNAVDFLGAKDALSVMDMIQHHLDEEESHHDIYLRRTCIQWLLHLNKRHGTLPTSIHLSKVTKDGHHPVSGGGFADIYKGRLEDMQPVCLKVLRVYTATYNEARLLRQLSNEVLIWRQLKHPNILQFLGITKELFQPTYCIISPWMANGTVISYSRLHKSTLNDKVKMMYEISEGIRYLHEHQPPIVHSDVKGLNILVSDDGKCCLADFGLAAIEYDLPEGGQVHLSTSQAVMRGSVPWLAPEVMNPNHFGVGSRTTRDIYALGCTMFELLTGNAPFSEKRMDFHIIMEVLNGSRPARPNDCPDVLWTVVESCWREDCFIRPSAAEVKKRLGGMISQWESSSLLMNRSPCLLEDYQSSSMKELSAVYVGNQDYGAPIWNTEEREVARILVEPSIEYDVTASDPEVRPAPDRPDTPPLSTDHRKTREDLLKEPVRLIRQFSACAPARSPVGESPNPDGVIGSKRNRLSISPADSNSIKRCRIAMEPSLEELLSTEAGNVELPNNSQSVSMPTQPSGMSLQNLRKRPTVLRNSLTRLSRIWSARLRMTDQLSTDDTGAVQADLVQKREDLRRSERLIDQKTGEDRRGNDGLVTSDGVDILLFELDAQRQRGLGLFSRKLREVWSGLGRKGPGSGCLSSDHSNLTNPNPEIFPVDHPHRSSVDIGMANEDSGAASFTPTEERKPQGGRMQMQVQTVASSSSNPRNRVQDYSQSPLNVALPNHKESPGSLPPFSGRIQNETQFAHSGTSNAGVNVGHSVNTLGETLLSSWKPSVDNQGNSFTSGRPPTRSRLRVDTSVLDSASLEQNKSASSTFAAKRVSPFKRIEIRSDVPLKSSKALADRLIYSADSVRSHVPLRLPSGWDEELLRGAWDRFRVRLEKK